MVEIAERYRDCGRFDREFVRQKLRHDPMYSELLRPGALPDRGCLVDLGCGRGILLALLAARAAELELVGVERAPRLVAVARRALGGRARLVEGDVREFEPPQASAIVLADVLHYLAAHEQERLLARAAAALAPGGVLVVREAAAGRNARFFLTRAAERACAVFRGHLSQRFHYRTARAWVELLERYGLSGGIAPSSAGTPFANVLLYARRPV